MSENETSTPETSTPTPVTPTSTNIQQPTQVTTSLTPDTSDQKL